MAVHTRGILEQREKALDPTVNRAAINDEATFGEPLDDIGVAQAVLDIPANSQRDGIVGDMMIREGTR